MNKFRSLALVGAVSLAGAAHAALPAGVQTGVSGIQTDLTSLIDMVWPVIVAAVAAVVIMKLFKRFVSKI